ncbi:response regulator [Streptomyces noursei]|uniref:response regulator n=1 Tax=Streptomyces noursei TaxID=1971 RepID=UPI00382BC84D
MSLTVVLAEDSPLMRDGLVGALTRFGHRVLAAVGDADALLTAARTHRPDIVVTDIRMPPDSTDDGLRAAVALRREHADMPVLVLSQYVEQSYAAHLLDLGSDIGVGYLLKDRVSAVGEFVDAVVRVAGGATVVDPEVVRQLLNRRRDPLQQLTPREREVLALMAEGRANADIARALFVTEAAVNKHVSNIFQKLDLRLDGPGHRRVLAVLAYLRA